MLSHTFVYRLAAPMLEGMATAERPLRLVQLSDIHCGEPTFDAKAMQSMIERTNELEPDLVAIPGTGSERNTINDAGDVLAELIQLGVDLVVSGHKHVPYFWGISGLLICNSGTPTTKRLRGMTPPSWTEIEVNEIAINVYLHYEYGRRQVSCVRHREPRPVGREGFDIPDAFLI